MSLEGTKPVSPPRSSTILMDIYGGMTFTQEGRVSDSTDFISKHIHFIEDRFQRS